VSLRRLFRTFLASRLAAHLQVVGLSGLLLSIVPMSVGVATWMQVEALRREWTVAGPPCRPIDPAAIPAAYDLKQSFAYMGADFAYHTGAGYCADIPERGLLTAATYQVCQFNNAGVLRVRTAGGSYAFGPLAGHRVTVTLRRGAGRGVGGGWWGTGGGRRG